MERLAPRASIILPGSTPLRCRASVVSGPGAEVTPAGSTRPPTVLLSEARCEPAPREAHALPPGQRQQRCAQSIALHRIRPVSHWLMTAPAALRSVTCTRKRPLARLPRNLPERLDSSLDEPSAEESLST